MTESFEEFLGILGDKVELRGFTAYTGGLDTKSKYCCVVDAVVFAALLLLWLQWLRLLVRCLDGQRKVNVVNCAESNFLTKFAGGATGTHSIYAKMGRFEIMYVCSHFKTMRVVCV